MKGQEVWYHTKSYFPRDAIHIPHGQGRPGVSPRKVEYLKYLFQQGTSVKTNNLATHFGVDPSTITKMIGELAERATSPILLTMESAFEYCLTI